MCQLYAMLANEPTKVECSLVHAQNALMQQCHADSSGLRHSDGWGLVCYDEHDRSRLPTTIKHHNAAYDEPRFSRSGEKVFSKAIVAHVRLATVGHASTLNAHPFTYDEWTFAHNGTIPCFEALSRFMEGNMGERFLNCRLGTTDSELLFLWLLYQMDIHGINSENVAAKDAAARDALSNAVVKLSDMCFEHAPDDVAKLNFVLTNGSVLFACRWNKPMYKVVRNGVYDCEICGSPHVRHNSSVDYHAVAVASKPITQEPWLELPNFSLMYVSPNLECNIEPIDRKKTSLTR